MFTGIVEEVGEVVDLAIADVAAVARLTVRGPRVCQQAARGDSIAVNGTCLTVVDVAGDTFTADVSAETLGRTSLARAEAGARVNLERPATLTTRLGGHLVQGHVDGLGTLLDRSDDGLLRVGVPAGLSRYLVEKGSVTVDGVSLTVVDVTDDSFTVALIPTTQELTTLGRLPVGARVNLEVDVVAKYVERLLAAGVGTVAVPDRRQEDE